MSEERQHYPIRLEEKDGIYYGAGPVNEATILIKLGADDQTQAAIKDQEGCVRHLTCDSPEPVDGSADCRIGTSEGSMFVYMDRTGTWTDYVMYSPHLNPQNPEEAKRFFQT